MPAIEMAAKAVCFALLLCLLASAVSGFYYGMGGFGYPIGYGIGMGYGGFGYGGMMPYGMGMGLGYGMLGRRWF
ncbi:hypothetical protein ElyMa_006614500 [Elysia marginata]|uniref:Uncharacterized protein n=1 Tax=Elysia marginata TaxID=1093978 RepID=A0AAV4IGV1_9GAST|nr:hypothetical protein ElyMa_006614500 [Elysia marginata]